MSEVVVIIGAIGSGKDHKADELVKQGYVRIDFKDELLNMASDLVGYQVKDDYEWFKENIVGVRRRGTEFQQGFAYQDRREIAVNNPDIMTGRKLLERLGTEVMRKRYPGYWVRAWANKVIPKLGAGHNVVVSDCRFMNEVDAVMELTNNRRFVFSNYKSHRYDATGNHLSRRLAQALLAMGMVDGQEIEERLFRRAEKAMEAT